jgi:hypothetical protein
MRKGRKHNMSLFLAPVHTWLFNKIRLFEEIEQNIIEQFSLILTEDYLTTIYDDFGYPLGDEPIETLIDTSNIHGWLQTSINRAEKRQATIIKFLNEQVKEATDTVYAVYYKMGKEKATEQEEAFTDANQIYTKLNDYLLEGMPCDRVNVVIEQHDNQLIWLTSTCVHQDNWSSVGMDVVYYYDFRAAFIKGFVEGSEKSFKYHYEKEPEQKHTIVKV